MVCHSDRKHLHQLNTCNKPIFLAIALSKLILNTVIPAHALGKQGDIRAVQSTQELRGTLTQLGLAKWLK